MSDVAVRVQSLHVHPVKSCAVVDVTEALVIETGFDLDRTWMLVDASGTPAALRAATPKTEAIAVAAATSGSASAALDDAAAAASAPSGSAAVALTQRELPRMTLVRPTLKSAEMVLRAPGMLALHIALDAVDQPTTVTLFGESVQAYDMGDLGARWFSDFLGHEVRMVRFDPEQRRLSDPRWTGELQAENAFQDGFPLLVASSASLDELNRRLTKAGAAAVSMARFRPNIVVDGLDAHGEDALDEIVFATDDGPIRLRVVKPCARCPIPDVDPQTGEPGHAVCDMLGTYRADPRRDGRVTFGMNAVIVDGIDRVLRVGMTGSATYRFD